MIKKFFDNQVSYFFDFLGTHILINIFNLLGLISIIFFPITYYISLILYDNILKYDKINIKVIINKFNWKKLLIYYFCSIIFVLFLFLLIFNYIIFIKFNLFFRMLFFVFNSFIIIIWLLINFILFPYIFYLKNDELQISKIYFYYLDSHKKLVLFYNIYLIIFISIIILNIIFIFSIFCIFLFLISFSIFLQLLIFNLLEDKEIVNKKFSFNSIFKPWKDYEEDKED